MSQHHNPDAGLIHGELGLSDSAQEMIIIACAIVSILFGIYNVCKVLRIKVHSYGRGELELQDTGAGSLSDEAIEHQMSEIARLIREGASTFLREEYKYTIIFISVFAVIIFFTAE